MWKKPVAKTVSECPVCLNDDHLAALDGCSHALCMDCVVSVSKLHAKCPLCRSPYTLAVRHGGEKLAYHISGKFKIPGFMWVSSFCMGLANKLIFEDEEVFDGLEATCVVMMPEYLNDMLACASPRYFLSEIDEDKAIHGVADPGALHEQRFEEMKVAVKAWKHLPVIYTKLTIARHVQRMIRDGLFMRLKLDVGAASREERRRDEKPGDIPEEDGGHKYIMLFIPST
ncbi:hypothetical protein T484DRAFT_1755499 [Baffinella frigidus]|nr:hypothetical protein T484DRAFT_1755499 [Cryptophyta sp. CCMP2293]